MLSCRQIADRIDLYLKRFEKDPVINKTNEIYHTCHYYLPCAWGTTKINIKYITYQNTFKLTKEEGLKYLKWLDEGNIGKHYNIPRKNNVNIF